MMQYDLRATPLLSERRELYEITQHIIYNTAHCSYRWTKSEGVRG